MALTVLAVNSAEAGWTLAHITNKGITPVGLTDLTYPPVVARVGMARPCVDKKKKKKTDNRMHLSPSHLLCIQKHIAHR